ncbi:hypothetical protein [Paracoccus yeei]|uniref:hypothetical protein n=1 Tax=Paracoccus yeei TaxID=147645 RepID=UPI001C8E8818|nr:hypothetical protein [Paracoccus yeei]MBY0135557.1 hypothetical protein [Paracoccus yeei]
MASNNLLPDYTTPKEIAFHLKVSERTVRAKARESGAYHLLGKRMILTDDDMSRLMEAMRPCPSKSTSAAKSGITGALLRANDYEGLVKRLTAKPRSASPPKSKREHGKVILMDQRQR